MKNEASIRRDAVSVSAPPGEGSIRTSELLSSRRKLPRLAAKPFTHASGSTAEDPDVFSRLSGVRAEIRQLIKDSLQDEYRHSDEDTYSREAEENFLKRYGTDMHDFGEEEDALDEPMQVVIPILPVDAPGPPPKPEETEDEKPQKQDDTVKKSEAIPSEKGEVLPKKKRKVWFMKDLTQTVTGENSTAPAAEVTVFEWDPTAQENRRQALRTAVRKEFAKAKRHRGYTVTGKSIAKHLFQASFVKSELLKQLSDGYRIPDGSYDDLVESLHYYGDVENEDAANAMLMRLTEAYRPVRERGKLTTESVKFSEVSRVLQERVHALLT